MVLENLMFTGPGTSPLDLSTGSKLIEGRRRPSIDRRRWFESKEVGREEIGVCVGAVSKARGGAGVVA